MTLLYHLGYIGRAARATGADRIEYLDGAPPPTEAELDASRETAQAAWDLEQALDSLPQRREEMAELFDGLPIDQQAALFATRVTVEQALDRGRIDIARQIVLAAVIPVDLESTRTAILDLFPPLSL